MIKAMTKFQALGLTLMLLASTLILKGQETVTLSGLLKGMEQWNRLYRVTSATDSVYGLRKANIKVNYLPKVDFNAEATWQSDVTKVNISVPGISIPMPDKDNYKLTVDLSQLIWDGGATKTMQQMEEENRKIEQNRVESEIYTQKERVALLFFGMLSIDMANRQLRLMAGELDKRIEELEAGVKAGVVLESSLNSLKAERLRLEQSLDANLAQRSGLVKSIYSLTGVNMDESAQAVIPTLAIPNQSICVRPDYKLFDIQEGYLITASGGLTSKRMPKLTAFARVGYGKPGLNMLTNEFDAFALVGARLSWNIWDWNSASRERQMLKIQQNILQYRREVYNQGCSAQVSSSLQQIQSLQRQIQTDEKIVELLDKSVKASASQLKNGTITSSVYLSDFNSLLRAKIEMDLHKVKLSQEVVKLYFTLGLSINE
ncbi:MAG: TolC family protein [Bacteroidota bacterium]